MKKIVRNLLLSGLIVTSVTFTSACEKGSMDPSSEQYVSIIEVANDGTTTFNEINLKSTMVETTVLNDTELAILLQMKDEEKLAHDVYTVLYEKWGNQVFSRISVAEDRHMNAVITLLKYYDSADTLVGDPGVFSNAEIQALYNELITKGSTSVEEAMMTGALIEEMDIKDLTEVPDVVTNENIIRVFENLLKSSRNHLRAFYHQLTKMGLVYTPVYISQEEYDAIVNSPMEQGNKYGIQNNNKQNRNGQGNGDRNGYGNGNGHDGGNGNGNGNGH
jgi:hypothetical protein